MKKLFWTLLCVGLLFGTSLAQAEPRHGDGGEWRGGIRSRISSAHEQIERGVARGSLTRQESHRLRQELGDILATIDSMKDDGRLSSRERDRINEKLDRLDRDIRREKHDDDRRGDRGRDGGEWRGGIRSRISSAHEEIERGVARGSLTRQESHRLRRELGDILATIDRMKDDGRLSSRERDRINEKLDRLDRDIRREKRDDDRRGDRRRDRD